MLGQTKYSILLRIVIFCHAMWFFGNLYEQTVDVPNLLVNSLQAQRQWVQYHAVTNPIYYHVPNTLIGLACLLVCHLNARKFLSDSGKRTLRLGTLYSLTGVALTVIIVLNLNLKLFLSSNFTSGADIQRLATIWLTGNGTRLLVVGLAIRHFLQSLSHAK